MQSKSSKLHQFLVNDLGVIPLNKSKYGHPFLCPLCSEGREAAIPIVFNSTVNKPFIPKNLFACVDCAKSILEKEEEIFHNKDIRSAYEQTDLSPKECIKRGFLNMSVLGHIQEREDAPYRDKCYFSGSPIRDPSAIVHIPIGGSLSSLSGGTIKVNFDVYSTIKGDLERFTINLFTDTCCLCSKMYFIDACEYFQRYVAVEFGSFMCPSCLHSRIPSVKEPSRYVIIKCSTKGCEVETFIKDLYRHPICCGCPLREKVIVLDNVVVKIYFYEGRYLITATNNDILFSKSLNTKQLTMDSILSLIKSLK